MASVQDRSEIMSRGKKLSRRKNLLPAILGAAALAALAAGLARHEGLFKSAPWPELMSEAETLDQNGRHVQAGRMAQAAFREVQRENGPTSDVALEVAGRLAQFYRRAQEWAALDQLAAAMRAMPRGDFEGLRQRGLVLAAEEDYADAGSALRAAQRLRPGDQSLHADLGDVYFQEGRYAAAARELREALKADPRHAWLWLELSRAYQMLGDYPNALRAIAGAKRADPSERDAYIQEGYAKLAHGDVAEAKKEFWAVSTLPNGYVGSHHLGWLASSLGQTRRAISLYEDALKRIAGAAFADERTRDDRRHAFFNMANIYVGQGRTRLAEACFRKARRLSPVGDPRWFQSSARLASLYEAMGRGKAAEEIYRQCEDFCRANNEHPRASCFGILALHSLLALKEGRRTEAASLYGEALHWRPAATGTVPDILMFCDNTMKLARVADALGHRREAERLLGSVLAFKRAASTDNLFHVLIPGCLQQLADLYDEDGRRDAATRLRREAEALEKGTAKARREARRPRARIAPRS